MSKKKHGEAHGGAWKVAYADFVTAMMALFMVLWISAQQKEILIATSKYFQNPFSSPLPASSGVMEGKKEKIKKDENEMPSRTFTPEMYAKLAKEFLKLLDVPDQREEKPIEIKVVGDSIMITLYNRSKQPIFENNTTKLTEWGDYLAQNMAWIVDRFHMRVRVDAHLPKNLFKSTEGRDGWDLTSDQANVMRRQLTHYGLDITKIERVTGYADTKPLENISPADPTNYRLEMSLTATEDTPIPSFRDR